MCWKCDEKCVAITIIITFRHAPYHNFNMIIKIIFSIEICSVEKRKKKFHKKKT